LSEDIELLKRPDEMYCKNCGNIISKDAIICPKCGIQVNDLLIKKVQAKDKSVAILLAIFLGFWAWIYTWEKDYWKFWLALSITIVTIGIASIAFYIWVIIDAASRPIEFYLNFPNF